MKKAIKHFITIKNKKYFYSINRVNKEESFFECAAANISQEFLNADIPNLLNDLPGLIIAEQDYRQQDEVIRFRVSAKDKKIIELKAIKRGYASISGYLRDLALGK